MEKSAIPKIPVILFTCKPEQTESSYSYPEAISLNHIIYINQLPDSPYQRSNFSLYTQQYGEGEYTFQTVKYCYWWCAGLQQQGQLNSYVRIVLALCQKSQCSNKYTVRWNELWAIDDNTSKEDLCISLVPSGSEDQTNQVNQNQSPSNQNPPSPSNQNPPSPSNQNPPSPSNQNPPSPSNQNPPSPSNQNPPPPPPPPPSITTHYTLTFSPIKQGASSVGRMIFWCLVILSSLFAIYLLVLYSPIALDVLARCPVGKGSQAFITIAKTDDTKMLDCPFATPVYNNNFVKIGSVDRQDNKFVKVMIFPDHRTSAKQCNVAYHHQEPRKVLAIAQVLLHSMNSGPLQEQFEAMTKKIQPHCKVILKRIVELIKENYPPEKQEELCQALLDEKLGPFMLSPLTQKFEDFKKALADYRWKKVCTEKNFAPIAESAWQAYSREDMIEDSLSVCIGSFWGWVAGDSKLASVGKSIKGTGVKRLGTLLEEQSVQTSIKKTAYDITYEVANDIGITKNGDVWEGEYYKALKGNYTEKLDFLYERLHERGYSLTREEIVRFWSLLEDDTILQEEYGKIEKIIENDGGKWITGWVQQFFPSDPDKANEMQIFATTLMREILYGKPEPILVITQDDREKQDCIQLKPAKWQIGRFSTSTQKKP